MKTLMPRCSSIGLRLLVADGRRPVIVGLLEDLERPPGRLAGADHDVDVDRLALLDVGRDRDLLDQDLAVVEVLDRQDVDLHAQRLGGQAPARSRLPRFSLPSESDDDPPGRVLGKRRQGQLDGRAQVGVLGVDRALDAQQVELAGGRGDLDPRLLAEDHHAGQVVLPPLLRGLGHVVERRLLLLAGDAVGDVEQEDRRQAVGAPHRLQLGQGQHDQGDHRRPEQDRQRPADRPQPGQAAIARPDQRRQDQRNQDQPPGVADRDRPVAQHHRDDLPLAGPLQPEPLNAMVVRVDDRDVAHRLSTARA